MSWRLCLLCQGELAPKVKLLNCCGGGACIDGFVGSCVCCNGGDGDLLFTVGFGLL